MWAQIHTARISISIPALQSKRMAVDVKDKERSGVCRVRTRVLRKGKGITDVATPKPPFECATFWVQSRQIYECALLVYSEQHLGTFGRNPKEVREVGLARSSLYPP